MLKKQHNFYAVALALIGIAFIFGFTTVKKSTVANDEKLIGTWQLCNYNTLQPDTAIGGKFGSKRFKFITENKFLLIETKMTSRALVGSFSGFYTTDDGMYIETVDVNAPNIYGRPGQATNKFTYKIKDKLPVLRWRGQWLSRSLETDQLKIRNRKSELLNPGEFLS